MSGPQKLGSQAVVNHHVGAESLGPRPEQSVLSTAEPSFTLTSRIYVEYK